MSKSIKFNDDIFLDSTGIVHNKTFLSSILTDLLGKIDKTEIDSYSFAANGYIRFTNGFQIAWITKNVSYTNTAWGSLYYADFSLGNWSAAFSTLYITVPYVNKYYYWGAIGNASKTSAGTIRTFRPTQAAGDNIWIGAIGFGKWK